MSNLDYLDDIAKYYVRETHILSDDPDSLSRSPYSYSNSPPFVNNEIYEPEFPDYLSTSLKSQCASEVSDVSEAEDLLSLYAFRLKVTYRKVRHRLI